MSRGGKRPGAGRKPGNLSKKTVARQRLAAAAAADGISPLELMLKRMRFYNELADRELERGEAADHDAIDKALRAASEAAKDAAPYVHPRLSAIEHSGTDDEAVSDLSRLMAEIDGTTRGLPKHCSANANPRQTAEPDFSIESGSANGFPSVKNNVN